MGLLLHGRRLVLAATVAGAALLGASLGGMSTIDRDLEAAVAAPAATPVSTVELTADRTTTADHDHGHDGLRGRHGHGHRGRPEL